MAYTIVLSPRARAQLDELYDYIGEAASPAVARNFVSAILDQLDELRDFPNLGTKRDDVLPGLRTIGFRRRVTIAFVVESTQVFVIGIFYGGRDFEALLKDSW